jgi:hypothetical protein
VTDIDDSVANSLLDEEQEQNLRANAALSKGLPIWREERRDARNPSPRGTTGRVFTNSR